MCTYHSFLLSLIILLGIPTALPAQEDPFGNNPNRIEWFRDLGFGLFIHWSMDSQLGSVISHSMVGASEDYLNRFIHDLPQTFNPYKYKPQDWAVLARVAGFKYAVFTTKHHSGFCMFNTKTTNFNIMNTPYKKDTTKMYVKAFREQSIPVGFYFSPDDFWFLHQQGTLISRRRAGVTTQENPGLLKHDQTQLRELLTRYGNIDLMFIDGPAYGLTELCWKLQPDLVITRGAMETPEQYIPGQPLEGPWEACMTLGTQWQYKPTNDTLKDGTKVIETLIETRAKGGNFLLNVGPDPYGEIPKDHADILREVGLWNFINGEAIYGVRPWIITNEGNLWFTKKKNTNTVYVCITKETTWKRGDFKTFTVKSIQATGQTKISVLGQNDQVVEYSPDINPQTTWEQTNEGLTINVCRAQRIYNDHTWPNPVVLKITHAAPGKIE